MDYLNQQYLEERIKRNQRFLLKLLNLHIFGYYPLRRYLGISIGNKKIDEISHLSWAYDTKYFKKGKKWYKQQTRTYQQPDLGYKLNLVLDKIPQLAISALLQPVYGLGALAFFFLTQTTYQPSTKDTYISSREQDENKNFGTETDMIVGSYESSIIHWDITDVPDGAVFSQGSISLRNHVACGKGTIYVNRLTQTDWVETQATWNIYKTGSYWDTPGGDYTTTNRTSAYISGSGWYTWNSYQLIQDCYDNQSKNVHVIFPKVSGVEMDAYTREYANTSLRPKLTVTYTVPVDNAILFSCNF